MREHPSHSLETYVDGRLAGMKFVYVADAATFPTLPAKNHSFTIMANAMRIADAVRLSLGAR
jgi:choline dehydrogenase-like flavoprotein